jgi:hypothetical protein
LDARRCEKSQGVRRWWKTAAYEQRLVIAKKYFDRLNPEVISRWGTAKDIAKIDDISAMLYRTMLARTAGE